MRVDRAPGGGHAAQVAVGHRLVHVFNQRLAHAVGHGEAEAGGVAGVELEYLLALFLQRERLKVDGAANVGSDFVHALGLRNTCIHK